MDGYLRAVTAQSGSISDGALRQLLEDWIEANRETMVQDIFTVVSIPSVSGKAEGRMPYGAGCGAVLEAVGRLVAGAGFTFQNHAYHCGTAQLEGSGEETIGIFSHIDTVAPGDGWNFAPYRPFLKDGYLYGRGVTDDKGPAVAALYVLKCLRDLRLPLRHNVMVYFGCDEESSMGDIHYYLAHNKPPAFSLVPDARFSVCCGEKGIISAKITMDLRETGIRDFQAGSGENIVPNFAEVSLTCSAREAAQIMAREELTVAFANGVAVVHAEGVAGHAAFPENTENAIDKLTNNLEEIPFSNTGTVRVLKALAELSRGYRGEGIGIHAEDAFFGPLTSVAGTARVENGALTVTLNIRYPISTDRDTIRARLSAFCTAYGAEIASFENSEPAYFAPDGEIPTLLNDLCREVLRADFAPYSMGGGTYARHLPNAMACGPLNRHLARPGGTRRGGGHQPDECVCLESLENLIKIYVRAIAKIDRMI